MYLLIIQEYKNEMVLTTIRTFKRKFIGFWLCYVYNKIRKRKIQIIKK